MQNFRALGAPPPDPVPPAAGVFVPKPPASGGWELRPQTSIAFGGWGLHPQIRKTAPPCEFLATRVVMLAQCG